jgi:hypothetical protein
LTPARHCNGAKFPLIVSRSLMTARSRIAWANDTAEVHTTEIVDSRENRGVAIPKRDRRPGLR